MIDIYNYLSTQGSYSDGFVELDNARKYQVRFSKFSLLYSHFVFHDKNIQIRWKKKYHTFDTVLKSNRKERRKKF
jgi:hypothetical protein